MQPLEELARDAELERGGPDLPTPVSTASADGSGTGTSAAASFGAQREARMACAQSLTTSSMAAAHRHNGQLRQFLSQDLDSKAAVTEGICFGTTLNWASAQLGGETLANALTNEIARQVSLSDGMRYLPVRFLESQQKYETLHKTIVSAAKKGRQARSSAAPGAELTAVSEINAQISALRKDQFDGRLVEMKEHATIADACAYMVAEARTPIGDRPATYLIAIFMKDGAHAVGAHLAPGGGLRQGDFDDATRCEFIDPNFGIFSFANANDVGSFCKGELPRWYGPITSVNTYELGRLPGDAAPSRPLPASSWAGPAR